MRLWPHLTTMVGQRPTSRRLPLWFAAATVPATLALLWLGWAVVRQDRLQAQDLKRTEREQAADLAVAALAQTLAEFETALGSVGSSPKAGAAIDRRVPVLVFDSAGVVSRAGLSLPYYPAVSRATGALPLVFDRADDLEFAKGDFDAAIATAHEWTEAQDPAIRAEAWLRIARNYRKAGQNESALRAWTALTALDDVTVQGIPAGLLGRTGRALIFFANANAPELRREADALRSALIAGRWRVTEPQFEHSIAQIAEWTGDSPSVIRERVTASQTILAASRLVWDERATVMKPDAPARRSIRVNDVPVLVLMRRSGSQTAVMLLAPDVLQEAWHRNMASAPAGMSYVINETDGPIALGNTGADPASRAVRSLAGFGVPWTVTAIDRETSNALSAGARMMLAGVAFMVLLVMLSGYAVLRAVSREMRVAQLQADFVAAVSHEFRTPLTTIRQLSEMLVTSRVSNDERRQQFYAAIDQESGRLQRLVEGLLDFGRMETGRLSYSLEPLDLGQLIADVASSVGREAAPTGHRIEVAQADPLPAIRADRDALGHAIRNLLDNAVKYSPDHKVIQLSVSSAGSRVSIRVRDHGLGIPVDEQHAIFEKFVRGTVSRSRNIAGTGVGLAMARQIVLAHEGTISVESRPGQGSTFTIDLPAAPAASL